MTKAAELAKMGEVLTNSQIGGRRNIIINGAMQVAQRGTSSTGVGDTNGVYPTVDRFIFEAGNTAGRLTMTQETISDLSGFTKAIKLACTTADTSIAADEFLMLGQRFEGQDLQQLKKGTSDAEKVTVSFYVKGNANATYTLELRDNDNSRSNSQEFSVTTSWNRVSMTFDGDTSGALDNDNALSLKCNIWLHGGSTYTGGTHTSNTWHGTTNQRVGDNQTSFFDSTDRTFFVTGWQVELGSQATPFEHRSFGEELTLCQRYFYVQREDTSTGSGHFCVGQCNATTRMDCILPHPHMRLAHGHTISFDTASDYRIQSGGTLTTCSSMAGESSSPNTTVVFATVSSGLTAGNAGLLLVHTNSPVDIKIDSEL